MITCVRIRSAVAVITTILAALMSIMGNVFAAPPSAPSQVSGSIAGSVVSLEWTASQDDNSVPGYNVYRNDRYIATVSANRYRGPVDATVDNSFYIVAFDLPLTGEQRSFSDRSDEFLIPAKTPASDTVKPSTPTNLMELSAGDGSVSFSWDPSTDNVGVLGYNVYRQNQYIDTVSDTIYTDTTPLNEATVTYSVVAFDAAKNFTPQSAVLLISSFDQPPIDEPVDEPIDEPDQQAPSVPASLAVTDSSEQSVTLVWAASTDNVAVDGYNVYRDDEYYATVRSLQFVDSNPPVTGRVGYSLVSFDLARNYSTRSAVLDVVIGPVVNPDPPNDGSEEMVPVLDPNVGPVPSPDPNDPFGSQLEIDNEVPVPGGPPTRPKNLRIDLVSNDWAEINWAPSNDDIAVVAYNIYRSDGTTYVVGRDQLDINPGAQAEIDKYWSTTSFIDCNYTRFDTRVHNCRANSPQPGDTFSYEVTAVDQAGNESQRSEPITITYHIDSNAPVPLYDDFYKAPDDDFAQRNDLSRTNFFLDEFDLVFADEFDGNSLDPDKWQTELTWQDSTIINGEQQYFVRIQAQPDFGYDPFSFDGEALTISAIPTPDNLQSKLPTVCFEADPTGNERCQFLSGALSSHDRFGFLYGYVEGRMKVGGTAGMLSSFYLYHRYKGSGVQLHAPEIDIIEYLGENPFGDEDAFQTYHFDDVTTGLTRSAPTMSFENPDGELYSDDYHTFGVLWEPQLVIWYIDGKEVKRLSGPMVSRQPMNIVNYLVAGSAWAPTPDVSDPNIFPLEFDVDYIRVFQREAYQGTASFGPAN